MLIICSLFPYTSIAGCHGYDIPCSYPSPAGCHDYTHHAMYVISNDLAWIQVIGCLNPECVVPPIPDIWAITNDSYSWANTKLRPVSTKLFMLITQILTNKLCCKSDFIYHMVSKLHLYCSYYMVVICTKCHCKIISNIQVMAEWDISKLEFGA